MIRKATLKDIKSIHRLLAEYGSKGQLLSRPLSELYDHVRDFWVATDKEVNDILGCCALQICWEDLAEIRSLAVDERYWKKRIGTKLIEKALSEAGSFNISKIFTLTYQPTFFNKYGFKEIDKSKLPLKIWADCILCVKFPDCDETAMMKKIPLGITTFAKIRDKQESYLYVDKTAIAYQLIGSGEYYFLSRPRRFGKSLFVDTLNSLFQ